MLQFWILAALLILLALLFVMDPWIRARRHTVRQQRMEAERQQQNVAIFKDRMAELDAEREAGQLSDEQYQDLRAELETVLLGDVEGFDSSAVAKAQGQRLKWLTLVLVLVVPLATLGLYFQWGAYEGLKERQWQTEFEQGDAPDVEQLLVQLEQKLKENPDNPDGWFMLARSRMSMGHYEAAASAFLRLAQLLDANPEDSASIYGLYAQALYFANQGKFDQRTQDAIGEAFKRNPEEINALGLLGIQAFEQGNYAAAALHWQKILEVQPDSPNAETIRNGIARAQQLMAESGQTALPQDDQMPEGSQAAKPEESVTESTGTVGPAGTVEAPSLQVSVSLSPQLAAQVNPDDTVFVYARAINGARMPLAIVRKRVDELPLTVTLDDSTAMGPMANLSSVEQVELIARVSKLGTPAPNSGDLEGMVAPVEVRPGVQSLEVVISQQVP